MSPVAPDLPEEPLFERLHFLDDREPHGGPFNMALDEALLAGIGEFPLLRTYRWREPTVSFGYFEPLALVRASHPGWAQVRRWTGGGVVEHGEDFTYSLLVPRAHPLAQRASAADSYRLIHQAVARALAHLGAASTLSGPDPAGGPGGSRACFVRPVRHDLLLGGRKVAGAAQRRTRQGLLHQGSVQGLGALGHPDPARALAAVLPGCLGRRVVPRGLPPELAADAGRLAAARYGAAAWLARF